MSKKLATEPVHGALYMLRGFRGDLSVSPHQVLGTAYATDEEDCWRLLQYVFETDKYNVVDVWRMERGRYAFFGMFRKQSPPSEHDAMWGEGPKMNERVCVKGPGIPWGED